MLPNIEPIRKREYAHREHVNLLLLHKQRDWERFAVGEHRDVRWLRVHVGNSPEQDVCNIRHITGSRRSRINEWEEDGLEHGFLSNDSREDRCQPITSLYG